MIWKIIYLFFIFNGNLFTFRQLFPINNSLFKISLIVQCVVVLTTILLVATGSGEGSIIYLYNKIENFGCMSYVMHVNNEYQRTKDRSL